MGAGGIILIRCTSINGFRGGGHLIDCNLPKNHFINTDNNDWGNFRMIAKKKESNLNG
jgi:hypothetical protein